MPLFSRNLTNRNKSLTAEINQKENMEIHLCS